MTGLSPYYLWGKEQTRKDEDMREVFDRELNDHLERTEKKPFRECAAFNCTNNIFDFDTAVEMDGEFFCEECASRVFVDEVTIEPTEYR